MPVEGRDLTFQTSVHQVDSQEIGMSLLPPLTVGKLQEALHTKAKESPTYRFYALYDKVYRADVLAHAYHRCRVNDGAAGVDGQTVCVHQELAISKVL
jgi:RNA-directed DNA polymerase